MCVGERLQRGDRSRRLPSAHETAAVVDRPTNNGLISPVLLVFPFLPPLTRHTRVRLSTLSSSFSRSPLHPPFCYLSLSFSLFVSLFPFLLHLFLRSRTTFPRTKVERSPGSESTTSSGIAHARTKEKADIYICIYIYYILATKQIPATATFLPV